MSCIHLDDAIAALEKANADLDSDLLTVPEAKDRLSDYAKARRLLDYGIAQLSAKIENADSVARVTGTSIARAKDAIETGKVLASSPVLIEAMRSGDVSLDQAATIARAEASSPGAAASLLPVAKDQGFHVLRDAARRVALESEQHRDLADRQRRARNARTFADDLGMVNLQLRMQPHIGTPLVAKAEAEAQRLMAAAKAAAKAHAADSRTGGDEPPVIEPFERYLADAFAQMLAGNGKSRTTRPELVVLVSHEVAKRGWNDVRKGEVCKIPGIGPVPPKVARQIADDAFLNGVFFDGKDLRHFKRWSRSTPVEVKVALELGDPPDLDGVKCVDCGSRFRPESDHDLPIAALGPTSTKNNRWRCHRCHLAKTDADRRAGRLRPTTATTRKIGSLRQRE